MEKCEISIPDMQCEHCLESISDVLNSIKGVKSYESDLKHKKIIVFYNAQETSVTTFISAIDEIGFTALAVL